MYKHQANIKMTYHKATETVDGKVTQTYLAVLMHVPVYTDTELQTQCTTPSRALTNTATTSNQVNYYHARLLLFGLHLR